jgi:serine/threonine protein kinase/DNA-binding CsgD family transcriptional regulator
MASPPPIIQERYRLIRQIGEGGMATVYLAHDEVLTRDVAIKFLMPERIRSGDGSARFLREARTIARLSHTHLMTLYDAGHADNWYYLVLEYLPGQNLYELLTTRNAALPVEEAVTLIIAALEGLAYAHAQGIVHRDIKPENIIITEQGILKVADFGLAIAAHEIRLTAEGTFVGTLLYMPPEQINGDAVDARSDLYALGAVFYELLTQQPPYTGKDPIALISQILFGSFTSPRSLNLKIPAALEAIMTKMLAKQPDDRYPDADAVLTALRDYQANAVPASPPRPGSSSLMERIASSIIDAKRPPHEPLLIYAALEDTAEQVEAERRRIAGLLETQMLAPLNLLLSQANAYEQTLSQNPQAHMAVSVLNSLARQVLQQVRDLSAKLHSTVLESLGLEPALEALAEQERRVSGAQITLFLERQRERLPAPIELALYRAAQEALFQALHEVRATQVMLRLSRAEGALTFDVTSNGQPHRADASHAVRQRINALGGTFELRGAALHIRFIMQPPVDLTERELEVLRLLAEGLSNKEIAAALTISHRTVKFHLDNLYSKLGVKSRTEAAIYALRQGLLRH